MKKILFIIQSTLLEYQRKIIDELLLNNRLDCYCLVQEKSFEKKEKRNTLISALDKRFSSCRFSALRPTDASIFTASRAQLKLYSLEAGSHFDLVVDLQDLEFNPGETTFSQLIKPYIATKEWDSAVVNNQKYTTIQIEVADEQKKLSSVANLSFGTRSGVYNNRDTAYFYFAYLLAGHLRGQIFNTNMFETKGYRILGLIRYYAGFSKAVFKRKFYRYLSLKNWKIAFIKNGKVELLDQPKNTFWADPFLFEHEDAKYVFFEEFNLSTNIGHISVVKVENAKILEKHSVLLQPFHVSFPSVFKKDGSVFMMIEQSISNQLSIYKATNFPLAWELHRTIIENIEAVDPSWIFYENRYWLFLNKIDDFEHENNERLYIYYADDLFSTDWKPHSQNPVLIDIQKARNAGQLYFDKGNLMRPSQNCQASYGAEVFLNKIVELTPDRYVEVTVSSFKGFNKYSGMHTVNFLGDTAVTDFLIKE